jgi:LuxR family quorum sensing-dependent transcriptional regulator
MSIEEFIEATNRARSVDELFEIYKKAMAGLGFDRLIFSLMTDHVAIRRRAGHGIMLNYPQDWMKHYGAQNYEALDPVRKQMYAASGPFVWKNLMTLPVMTKRQHLFMQEGDEAGLHDGLGVPLRGPRGAIAGVGAASSSGGIALDDPTLLCKVNLLSQQFYTVYLSLEERHLAEGQPQPLIYLTDREQEILQWCAAGKTRGEIADILEMSEHTTDWHIKNILRKMGVNNIVLAAFKALHMGLIQV